MIQKFLAFTLGWYTCMDAFAYVKNNGAFLGDMIMASVR
jgi:hypothetical protein